MTATPWRFLAFCYVRFPARGIIHLAHVQPLDPPSDAQALAAAGALIGVPAPAKPHPLPICGVQLARTQAAIHATGPLPPPSQLLLVDERGTLPATRLHRPRLTPTARAHLAALLAGTPPPGTNATIRRLRAMGLLSPDGQTVTPFALRLFGDQIASANLAA